MKLRVNISPCPNDTFMFEAMLGGRVDTEGLDFDVRFADIEELNKGVIDGVPHVSKISCAVLPRITDKYAVSDSGSALGRGNGPLVVATRSRDLSDCSLRVAVPGMNTTANRLMQVLFPSLTDKTSVLFSEIADRVSSGEFDAGVLIHEGRFTFEQKGLVLIADLGKEWERVSSLPLPLGLIVVDRHLPAEVQRAVERVIARSVRYAMDNPGHSKDFVREHARELSDRVTGQHIDLFVNHYSLTLGQEGRQAVSKLSGLDGDEIFVG